MSYPQATNLVALFNFLFKTLFILFTQSVSHEYKDLQSMSITFSQRTITFPQQL